MVTVTLAAPTKKVRFIRRFDWRLCFDHFCFCSCFTVSCETGSSAVHFAPHLCNVWIVKSDKLSSVMKLLTENYSILIERI